MVIYVKPSCSSLTSHLLVVLLQHSCLVSRAVQQAIGSLLWWLPACPVCLWVGQSKDSPFLSPMQCLLPQWDSQTWTGQGVTESRISHQWLTTAAGALGSFSESQMRHVPFPSQQAELFVLLKQHCFFLCRVCVNMRERGYCVLEFSARLWHFGVLILEGSSLCNWSILLGLTSLNLPHVTLQYPLNTPSISVPLN